MLTTKSFICFAFVAAASATIFYSNTLAGDSVRFKKVDEFLLRDGGGSMSTHLVYPERILTFDSKIHVNLWEFNGKDSKLKWVTGVSNDWASYNFAYCNATRCFAIANSNSVNNAILVYQVVSKEKIMLIKHLRFDDRFSEGPTMDFSFSSDGKLFAYSFYKDRTVEIVETKEFKLVHKLKHPGYVQKLRFLDVGQLAAMSKDNELTLWSLSQHDVKVRDIKIRASISSISEIEHDSEKGRLVVIYDISNHTNFGVMEIELKNASVTNNTEVRTESKKRIQFSRISPKFDYVVVGTEDSVLTIFDIVNSKVIGQFQLKDNPTSAMFLNEGRMLLVSCFDGRLYVFSRGGS